MSGKLCVFYSSAVFNRHLQFGSFFLIILITMPYATRQGTIEFPKRKSIVTSATKSVLEVKRTPDSKNVITTPSSSARKAFHDSSLGITGREKELKRLSDFLLSHLEEQTSGSMYISGLPGTGKTASVNYIIEKNALSRKYQIIKINCTAFNSSSAVFKRVCEGLKLKMVKKAEKEYISAIERYISKKHKMILLILDEIDQLESKSQSVLYKIFEWPSLKNSKIVLIGIANAMDLTDRNLPRLCSKVELKPVLLHFAPYTKDEITNILKSRLMEFGADQIFAPGAVELIAAKVAGTSGDIRRALDLGKRVVEIAEQKNQKLQCGGNNSPVKTEQFDCSSKKPVKRKLEDSFGLKTPSKVMSLVDDIVVSASVTDHDVSPQKIFKNKASERVCLGEITPQKQNIPSNSSPSHKAFIKSPSRRLDISETRTENSVTPIKHLESKSPALKKSPVKALKEEVVLRRSPRKLHFDVDSKDVISVVKNVFASSKNFKANEESTFPLHQKLLICTLLLIIKKGKKKDLNVGKLHQVYSKVCAKRGLSAVDKSGFLFLCRQVEISGVLHVGKGQGSLAKVSLQWDEQEIANALKDLNMLSSILNDTTCLS